MMSVPSPEFHYQIAADYLNPEVDKLCVVAPRGHAKSSLVACVFVLHHLCFGKGRKVVVLVSKTLDHTVRLLDTIKNVLEYSTAFRALFGYRGMAVARTWTRDTIVFENGDAIICRGTGQMIVGLKVDNQRPTLIVLDDPEDMNNTKTDEAMEQNLRWLLQSLLPSRDPKRGRCIVIGTPQHQRSMVMMLQQMQGWVCRHYKALSGEGPLELNNPNIKALWPEWMSVEKLLSEKAGAESINRVSSWYREYQCQVIGDEDQLFKEAYLQYWDGDVDIREDGDAFLRVRQLGDVVYDEPRIIPVNVFTGIDPASSTRQTADYSTIVNSAIDAEGIRYVVSYHRKRIPPMKLAELIIENYRTMKSSKTQIETVGYQEMLRDYLRRQSDYIPGLEVKNNPRTQKSARLETLEPYFHGRRVYIKRSMTELIDEMLMYPRGEHDDLLDGLYYSFKGMYKPYHEYSGEQEAHPRKLGSKRHKTWATA